MGYYSDVVIAIKPDQLKKDMFLQKPGVPKDFEMEDKWQKVNDDLWIYQYHQAKWYDSFKDVAEIMLYICAMDRGDYFFLRVGEDSGDIEEEGSLECNIWTETKIVIHY